MFFKPRDITFIFLSVVKTSWFKNILRIIPMLRVNKSEKFMLLGISKDCEKLNHANRKLRVHKFHTEEIFHMFYVGILFIF